MPERLFMDITGPSHRRMQSYGRLAPGRPVISAPHTPQFRVASPALSQQAHPAAPPQPITPAAPPIQIQTVQAVPAKLPAVARTAPVASQNVMPRQNRSTVLKRQAVFKSAAEVYKAAHPKRRPKKEHLLVMASFVMFLSGGLMALAGLEYRQQASDVAGISTIKPDPDTDGIYVSGPLVETDPTTSQYRNYATNPEVPRYIRIPDLNVNSRVRQVGINQSGAIQMPTSIFDMAWYKRSAQPGQNGVSLILGHVSGQTRAGTLRSIQDLKPGNLLEVELGDGTKVQYKVTGSKSYSKFVVDDLLKPTVSGGAELHIATYPLLSEIDTPAQPGLVVYATRM